MRLERIASARLAELATSRACLEDEVRPAALPRLAGVLVDGTDGRLALRLQFEAGPESRPVVELRLAGTLQLVCQRCLGPVPWPLEIEARLTVVPDEAAAEMLAEPFDSVLLDADGALCLRTMIEDEVLAVMPLAPLHDERNECRPAHAEVPGEVADQEAAGETARPFAGLRILQAEAAKSGK